MKKRSLYIPALGTEFTLASNWTFPLYHENRNDGLLKHFGVEWGYDWRRDIPKTEVTLPKGTVLKVHRIYIRSGNKDFDSVTFNASVIAGKKVKGCRFWAKLADVNRIEFVM